MSRRSSKTPTEKSRAFVHPAGDGSAMPGVVAELRRIMPDLYFINTPSSQMTRHLDVLRRVDAEKLVIDFHQLPNSRLTELLISAHDDTTPGLFARVCGVLAAENIDVQTAFVFTARNPASLAQQPSGEQPAGEQSGGEQSGGDNEPSRGIILDTLFVSEPYRKHQRALTTTTKDRLCTQLMAILDGVEKASSLSRLPLRSHPPLTIYDLSVVNLGSGKRTMITLRAQNTPGLLYRTATALAALNLDIFVAQINTEDETTNDVFLVTGSDGKALPESELLHVKSRLRSMLQNNSSAAALPDEL